jgi:iron complex transport system ATP-binding protein
MNLLDCTGIEVSINGRLFLPAFDWKIESGSCWGILGANGCGKSTLLKSVAGLLPLLGGSLKINGIAPGQVPTKQLAREVGMLHQETPFRFPVHVIDLVVAGRYPWQTWYSRLSDEDRKIASESLHRIGAEELSGRLANRLSGGEARKVAMAILLCQSPKLALLDEPENHLDPGMRYQLIGRLKEDFTRTGKALAMVLHDPSLALRYCSHLLLIDADGSVSTGTADEMATEEKLSAVYGHGMRITEDAGIRLIYPE